MSSTKTTIASACRSTIAAVIIGAALSACTDTGPDDEVSADGDAANGQVTAMPAALDQATLDVAADHGLSDALYTQLTMWEGPYGGLPPVAIVTPQALRAAYLRAMDEKRAEIDAIVANPDAPTFENTIIAYESAGLALDRVTALFQLFTETSGRAEYRPLSAELAPLRSALDDAIVLNPALFARIDAVHSQLPSLNLPALDARLADVIHQRFTHAGAQLDGPDRLRLKAINEELAVLRAQFQRNAVGAQDAAVVFVETEGRLSGLQPAQIAAAKAAAEQRGRPDACAIPIAYPFSNPVLRYVHDRDVRRQVWDLWITRAGVDGAFDNRPVTNAIIALRHEKATLLGHETFADYQTSTRMVGTPDVAMDLLRSGWRTLYQEAIALEDELAAFAAAEGQDITIEPWDYLYYREKLRAARFDLNLSDIQPYLTIDNVVNAMTASAEEAHGFSFRRLEDVETVDPLIRVYEVSRGGEVAGLIWMDLFQRPGKAPASYATQFRPAETFRGKVLPLVALFSAAPVPAAGEPALITWERANVIFHEFGHTLHTVSSVSPYPSLGTYALPWDYIEVAALFYERWFRDRDILRAHMRHHETGEPLPNAIIDRLDAAEAFDRNFSTSVEFLATAMVDLTLHMTAPVDGVVDVVAVENAVVEELGMPRFRDLVMRSYHAFHTFTQVYAAGVYTYFWSDTLAADIEQKFRDTPEGLRNGELLDRYSTYILDAANTIPADEAFRQFQGRDPDPAALFNRYGIALAPEVTEATP